MSCLVKQSAVRLFAVVALCITAASASDPGAAGFQKLVSLSGHWEGKDEQGKSVQTQFESVAGGTAVLETLKPSGMEEMLSVYSRDGESILLTHYCPTNNQPRMRALPRATDIKQLVFSFQDAANLPDLAVGHEYKLVMDFDDANHLTERWTWRHAGHDTVTVFHLIRKQAR